MTDTLHGFAVGLISVGTLDVTGSWWLTVGVLAAGAWHFIAVVLESRA